MISRKEQLLIESQLARQLTTASSVERAKLYGEVYDRIYEMHLSRDPDILDFGAQRSMLPLLERCSRPGEEVIEVGCGTGLLATELALRGRRVTGVDVSTVALARAEARARAVPGVRFVHSQGTELPLPGDMAAFAFSVEVVEHMHEEDVGRHLREVHRVLRAGGIYWLVSPNRINHVTAAERFGVDVDATEDVHLKEWTHRELIVALRAAGFTRIRSPLRHHQLHRLPFVPASAFAFSENLFGDRVDSPRLRSLLGLIDCSLVARKAP